MNELFDYGRPARIDLAVLADRGGRELPIEPRFCGARVEVPKGSILMLERNAAGGMSLGISAGRRARREGA